MKFIALVLANLVAFVAQGDTHVYEIDCSASGSCDSTTIGCDAYMPCSIYCGASGCAYSTIHCPSLWDCNITCSGTYACRKSIIYAPKNCDESLYIKADGKWALYQTNISAQNTAYVTMELEGGDADFAVWKSGYLDQRNGKSLTIYTNEKKSIEKSKVYGPYNGDVSLTADGSSVYGIIIGSEFYFTNSSNVYIECDGEYSCQNNTFNGLYSNQLEIQATDEYSLKSNIIYCNTKTTNGQNCIINGSSNTANSIILDNNRIYSKQGTTDLKLTCDTGDTCVNTNNYLICGKDLDKYTYPCYFYKYNNDEYWKCGNDSVTGYVLASEYCNSYTTATPAPTYSVSDSYFNLINSNSMSYVWFFGGTFLACIAFIIWYYWCCIDHNQFGPWWYEKLCPKPMQTTQEQQLNTKGKKNIEMANRPYAYSKPTPK